LPDGSLDFTIEPLNMAYPPVDASLAVEGNYLIYRASDGPRLLTGGESVSLRGDTDLLWRGYDRHGVSAINATGTTARFRMAISNGMLSIIVPEGTSTTTSTVLYRYNFRLERWYRHTYPTAWESIAREPDGTIIAGDSTGGYVYQIDTGTQDHTTDIPVVIWTGIDDGGEPLNIKGGERHLMLLDTGGASASISLYIDGRIYTAMTFTGSSTGIGRSDTTLTQLIADFTQLQTRLTGSFTTFRLYELGFEYNSYPAHRMVWDTWFPEVGNDDFVWLRQVRFKAKCAADMTVTPYFDGVAFPAKTVEATADSPTHHEVHFGREYKGHQARVIISSASPISPYWIDYFVRDSGHETQKRVVRVKAQ